MPELALCDRHAGSLEEHRCQRVAEGVKADALAFARDAELVQGRVKDGLHDRLSAGPLEAAFGTGRTLQPR